MTPNRDLTDNCLQNLKISTIQEKSQLSDHEPIILNLEKYKVMLFSSHSALIFKGLYELCRYIQAQEIMPIKQLHISGILARVVDLISPQSATYSSIDSEFSVQCHTLALCIIFEISKQSYKMTLEMVKPKLIVCLLNLLGNNVGVELLNFAIISLVNIYVAVEECKDIIFKQSVYETIFNLLKKYKIKNQFNMELNILHVEFRSKCIWILGTFCEGRHPISDYSYLKKAFATFNEEIYSDVERIMASSIYALNIIASNNPEFSQILSCDKKILNLLFVQILKLKKGCSNYLIINFRTELLWELSTDVLSLLSKLFIDNYTFFESVINFNDLISVIKDMYINSNQSILGLKIRGLICKFISVIYELEISKYDEIFFEHDLHSLLVNAIEQNDLNVKKSAVEAYDVVFGLMKRNFEFYKRVINNDLFEIYCKNIVFFETDKKFIIIILAQLHNILVIGKFWGDIKGAVNFSKVFFENDLVQLIQYLSKDDDELIRKNARDIIELFSERV